MRHRSYRRYLGDTLSTTYNNPLCGDSLTAVNRVLGSLNFVSNLWLNFIARGGLDTFNDDRTYFFRSFQVMELTLEDTKTKFIKTQKSLRINFVNELHNKDLSANITVGSAIDKAKQVYVDH
jgi:hypothetical protein